MSDLPTTDYPPSSVDLATSCFVEQAPLRWGTERENGASLVEYVLILALIAIATVVAVTAYGEGLDSLWVRTVTRITTAITL